MQCILWNVAMPSTIEDLILHEKNWLAAKYQQMELVLK